MKLALAGLAIVLKDANGAAAKTANTKNASPRSFEFGKPFTIDLDNFHNMKYTTKINIGNSSNPFRVLISTAFSSIFVPSLGISANTNGFDSNTCTKSKWNLKGITAPHTPNGIDNTTGQATCVDTVKMGEFKIQNQAFGLSSSLNPFYTNTDPTYRIDGLLGLGFQPANVFKGDTPLNNIFKQAGLTVKAFSVWLNRDNPERGGEITFGNANPDLLTGDVSFVALSTPNKAWKIKVDSFSFGSKVLGTNFEALVDVGDGCMRVPKKVLKEISKTISVDLTKTHEVPCNLISTYPALSFAIKTISADKKTFTVDSSIYVQPFSENKTTCYFCISSLDNGAWVIGNPFMNSYYTIFDADKQRIGFAKAKIL